MNKKRIIIIITIVLLIVLGLFFVFKNKRTLDNIDGEYIEPGFADINSYLYNSAVVNFNYANMASKNVQAALDELYTSIIGGCLAGYSKTSEVAGNYTCSKNSVGATQAEVFDSLNVRYDHIKSNSTGTNVKDSIIELANMRTDCKTGYTKEVIDANTYKCKKQLTITANSQTIVYGEDIDTGLDEIIVNGLLEGNTIHSITLTQSTTNITNNGSIVPSNAIVYDSNNNDITNTYAITYANGVLVIANNVCRPPTAVTVGIDGTVSWTNGVDAIGYEISIDDVNYTTFTNGGNYHSTITSSSGTRTVYVRSVCDSTQYDNDRSSAATKNVNVYSVSLTAGDGISSVTGDGNYISGNTVNLNATVSDGYTWDKWTTIGGVDLSNTQAYSDVITNNWVYTANATGIDYTVNYYNGNGTGTTGSTKIGSTVCTFGTPCTLKTWATLGAIFPYSSTATTNRGWSFYGWTTTANSTTRNYSDGASINPTTYSATINLYNIGRKGYKFSSGIAPKTRTVVYQYWNPRNTGSSYRTSISIPSATSLSSSANGTWTFLGYIGGSNAASNADVHFAASTAGTSYNPVIDTGATGTMRAKYKRTLTVKYNSNGGSGSMSNTTLVQYYNSGYGNADGDTNTGATLGAHSITLASNDFTKSGFVKFSKWAAGSASGTQYAAGASYTALGSTVKSTTLTTTMYAIWKNCCEGTGAVAFSGSYCYSYPVSDISAGCNYVYNGQCYNSRTASKCN